MADPFEVRMRFTAQLQHLNASTSSATKAANYALKHCEFSDDLHSCILEQLERNNMNNRANIMYFLPALCETTQAQGEESYVKMIGRDIIHMVDLVLPKDGSGAANVKVVRKVIEQMQHKGFFTADSVWQLREYIGERDTGAASPAQGVHAVQSSHLQPAGAHSTARSTPHSTQREQITAPALRLDKRQIEQRIEEDRERHKRAREGIWAVPQAKTMTGADAEFDKLWEEGSELDEDDYNTMREETQERKRWLEFEET